jgi:predicted Zn-dependent peptidase
MTIQTPIRQQVLPNGLSVVHEAMPWLGSVSFALLLPLGSVNDPKGQEGSASVLTDWLYRGAGELSSQAFSDKLDDLGIRRGGGTGKEFSTFSASLLNRSFAASLELYATMLRQPRLEPDEFEPARLLSQQELASLDDNPTQRLFETLSMRYFASAHGKSSYGTAEGLANLSVASVQQDYQKRISPKGAILSVAGGVSWDDVLKFSEKFFADWQGEVVYQPEVRLNVAHQDHIEQDIAQVQIGVAFEAVAPGKAGWYENALALNVLSGGMGARLFSEVREKRGLVYSVTAVSRAIRNFGYTLGYAGTTPERAEETLKVLLHELSRLSEGVSADELERARTGLLSQLIMQGEYSGARASALAKDTFLLGAPRSMEEIKAALVSISLQDLNGYLSEHYKPQFTVLTLGKKALEVSQ